MERKKRMYHRPLMQTEKFLSEGKRIMPETRFISFPALSVYPRVGISRSALATDVWLFFLPMTLKNIIYHSSFLSFLKFTSHTDLFRTSFGVFRGGAKMTSLLEFSVLTSLLTPRMSCLSPWARQNFPARLKIEQILSDRQEKSVTRVTDRHHEACRVMPNSDPE